MLPKKLEYYHLVELAKQVMLTVKLDNPKYLREDENGGLILNHCVSHMYLYGGTAPKTLQELLTFHHMHKLRKSWVERYLHQYFSMFLPGLTKKAMWDTIKERRSHYRSDWRKMQTRQERRTEQNLATISINKYDGKKYADSYPMVRRKRYDRLFPMKNLQYMQFILERNERLGTKESLNNEKLQIKYTKSGGYNCIVRDSDQSLDEWAIADDSMGLSAFGYGLTFRLFMQRGKMRVLEFPKVSYAVQKGLHKVPRTNIFREEEVNGIEGEEEEK